MKKTALVILFLAILLIVYAAIAENTATQEILTVENCSDLAEIMKLEDPNDQKIKDFAANFVGQTISFEGNLAGIESYRCRKHDHQTHYDMLIRTGDFSLNKSIGPSFQFKDVGVSDLGINGDHLPNFVRTGNNICVTAVVESFKESQGLFMLTPILLSERKKSHAIESKSEETTPQKTDEVEKEPEKEEVHYNTLKNGSKGNSVKTMQKRLIELHYLKNGSADGVFGKNTKTAIERFQSTNGLQVTGIADDATQIALYSDNAIEAKLSISQAGMVIGSNAVTEWNVDGQRFTLKGNQTKTVKTAWGTYRFDAFGNYEKISD